jgi:hypothetical protein
MAAIECFQRRKEFKTKAKGSNHEPRLIKFRTFSCNDGSPEKDSDIAFQNEVQRSGEMAWPMLRRALQPIRDAVL